MFSRKTHGSVLGKVQRFWCSSIWVCCSIWAVWAAISAKVLSPEKSIPGSWFHRSFLSYSQTFSLSSSPCFREDFSVAGLQRNNRRRNKTENRDEMIIPGGFSIARMVPRALLLMLYMQLVCSFIDYSKENPRLNIAAQFCLLCRKRTI